MPSFIIQRALAFLFCTVLCAASSQSAAAQDPAADRPLRAWELEELVDSIALYPDLLLKPLLPASTFPDQIVDAALLVKSAEQASLIKQQAWDESVKVIATYPGVLKMMFEELEWTTALGKAFMAQHKELLEAVQRLRVKAKANGNLRSNQYQNVSAQAGPAGQEIVVVQPTNPQVVYVPTETTVVYDQPSAVESTLVPLATFGLGMAVGAALADDDDDDHYYYGPGYWGAPVHWHGDDDFDDFVDHRQDMWDDYNDRRSDGQEHRQDAADDRREFRQDAYRDGDFNRNEFSAERKQQASQRVAQAKDRYPNAGATAQARQANRASASASGAWGTRSAQASARTYGGGSRGTSSGAFQGYGSGARTSAMSARGSFSRGGGGGRSGGGRRR